MKSITQVINEAKVFKDENDKDHSEYPYLVVSGNDANKLAEKISKSLSGSAVRKSKDKYFIDSFTGKWFNSIWEQHYDAMPGTTIEWFRTVIHGDGSLKQMVRKTYDLGTAKRKDKIVAKFKKGEIKK